MLTEKIENSSNGVERSTTTRYLKTVLASEMLWMHDCHWAIPSIKIKNCNTTEAVAQPLNSHLKAVSVEILLRNCRTSLAKLEENYQELATSNYSLENLNHEPTNEIWSVFLKTLKNYRIVKNN